MLGTGLDSGKEGERDDVNLLDREQWILRWHQYSSGAREFELENEFVIKGEKVIGQ